MTRVTESSERCARISAPRSSSRNHATFRPCSTACWPSASRKNVFPVPAGPQITRFSRRCTHSRVRSACWVGSGIVESDGSQLSKVFPVGNPAALRRAASMDRARPAISSSSSALTISAGSHRCVFAVANSSGARDRA